MKQNRYRYQPTANGMRYESRDPRDPSREIPCVLYPDNRRELYEGILGVRPLLQNGEVWLTPCLPAEMPHVDMHSAVMDYVYDRTDRHIRVQYNLKHAGCTLYVKLYLPVAEVRGVQVNGCNAAYTVEPAFCGVSITIPVKNASQGTVEVAFETAEVKPLEARRTLGEGDVFTLDYPDEIVTGLLTDVQISAHGLTARATGGGGSGVFFLEMHAVNRAVNRADNRAGNRAGSAVYIRPVKVWIGERKKPAVFRSFRDEFAPPYKWKPIEMDSLWNHASPMEALNGIMSTATRPPETYSQVNFDYYSWHMHCGFNTDSPIYGHEPTRWRSLVGDDGIAVTGEGIPFRSSREGNFLAAATLASPAYADRVVVPVDEVGRAVYLMITGITLPMQSHVENLRILIRYENGTEEVHPLVNPDGIGDMWFVKFGRYHDTPANGFENIGGGRGALSSAGLDLTRQIPTDMTAHILRFPLQENQRVREVEMRVIANDVVFALMGVTVLR